jgi:hypothetical protein
MLGNAMRKGLFNDRPGAILRELLAVLQVIGHSGQADVSMVFGL